MARPAYNPSEPFDTHGFEPAFTEIDRAAKGAAAKAATPMTGPPTTSATVNVIYRMIFGRNATATETTRWAGKPQPVVWEGIFLEKGNINAVGGSKPIVIDHIGHNLYADEATIREIFYFPSGSAIDYVLPMAWVGGPVTKYASMLVRWKATGKFTLWHLNGAPLTDAQRNAVIGGLALNPAVADDADLGTVVYAIKRSGGTTVYSPSRNRLYQNSTYMDATQLIHTALNFKQSGESQGQQVVEGTLDPAVGGTIPFVRTHNCFVAGTLIWTDQGLVPIEKIQIGDQVLSTDEVSGEQAYKSVVRTFVNSAPATVRVNMLGSKEVIEATLEHPFRVQGYHASGWVPAGELQIGDRILSREGLGSVAGVEFHPEEAKTYNFEVADWHTYHVGTDGWMVHNKSVLPNVTMPAGTEQTWMTIDYGTAATQSSADGPQSKIVIAPIVIWVATGVGRVGLASWNVSRGLMQGIAGSGSSNAILGIGRIIDKANPEYIKQSILLGYRYYSTTNWSPGHILAFVFGHALRHGPGSVRLVTSNPIAGSMTQLELGAAWMAQATRVGVFYGGAYSFLNQPIHANINTDYDFWYKSLPHTDELFRSNVGGFTISAWGGGPMYYNYPEYLKTSYPTF